MHKNKIILTAIIAVIAQIAIAAPRYHYTPTEAEIRATKIVDANRDGNTWQYNPTQTAIVYQGNGNRADDYAILPPMHFSTPGTYQLTLELAAGQGDRLQIAIDTTDSHHDFFPAVTIENCNSTLFRAMAYQIEIPDAGDYRLKLKADSQAGALRLAVRNITLTGTDASRSIPYHIIPTTEDLPQMTIVDNDGDGNKWRYDTELKQMTYPGRIEGSCWDYVTFPAAHIITPGRYAISLDARGLGQRQERIRVQMGNVSDPLLHTVIMTDENLPNDSWHNYSRVIEVTDTGLYYISIHAASLNGSDGIALRDLRINHTDIPAPPVMSLNLTPGEDGSYATAAYPDSTEADEWIILPAIDGTDSMALVEIAAGCATATPGVTFELRGGYTNRTENMQILAWFGSVINHDPTPYSTCAYIPRGKYYLAIHATGTSPQNTLRLHSLRLRPDTLQATEQSLPAEHVMAQADVRYTMPPVHVTETQSQHSLIITPRDSTSLLPPINVYYYSANDTVAPRMASPMSNDSLRAEYRLTPDHAGAMTLQLQADSPIPPCNLRIVATAEHRNTPAQLTEIAWTPDTTGTPTGILSLTLSGRNSAGERLNHVWTTVAIEAPGLMQEEGAPAGDTLRIPLTLSHGKNTLNLTIYNGAGRCPAVTKDVSAGSAATLTWSHLPDRAGVGDTTTVTVEMTNIGAASLPTPSLRLQLIDGERLIAARDTTAITAGQTRSLQYHYIPTADETGDIPVSIAAADASLSDILSVGAGRSPVVLDLHGEINSSGDRAELRWGEPQCQDHLPEAYTYNIYCDSILIASEWAQRQYTAPYIEMGLHHYNITVVDNVGNEYTYSNTASVTTTTAGNIMTDAPVYSYSNGTLLITTLRPLQIYTPAGVRIATVTSGSHSLPLSPGIYLLHDGHHTHTIQLR